MKSRKRLRIDENKAGGREDKGWEEISTREVREGKTTGRDRWTERK